MNKPIIKYASDSTDEIISNMFKQIYAKDWISEVHSDDMETLPHAFRNGTLRMFKITVEEIPYDPIVHCFGNILGEQVGREFRMYEVEIGRELKLKKYHLKIPIYGMMEITVSSENEQQAIQDALDLAGKENLIDWDCRDENQIEMKEIPE